jgi:hypothetical protein
MEAYGKQSSAFFGKLKTEALGLFLAFAGASSIKGFLGDMLEGDASAGRLARNLGVATQQVSAYRLVVKSLGGSAGDADATLGLLAQARESLRLTGTTGHDAELIRLGVTKEDLENPLTALGKIAKTGETMKREDYFGVLQRLGIPSGATESLNKGENGLRRMIDAKKADGAATDADAASAQKFQEKLTELESKITGIVRPSLYQLVDGLLQITTNAGAANAVVPLLTGIIGALGAAAVVAAGPYIALAAAITAVTVAYEDWQRLQNLTPEQQKGFEKRGQDILAQVGKAMTGDENGPHIGEALGILGRAFMERATGDPAMYGGQAPAAPAGGGGAPSGLAGRRAFIADFFRKQGYTGAQADGIVAAMQAENGQLSYRARNPRSAGRHNAYGLGQWVSADRRAAFKGQYGHEVEQSTYQEQLAFFAHELKNGQGGVGVKGSRTAQEAMEATVRGFFRPGDGTAGDLARGNRALGGAGVTIENITVNSSRADPGAVADQIPTAIKARLQLSQGNQGLLG